MGYLDYSTGKKIRNYIFWRHWCTAEGLRVRGSRSRRGRMPREVRVAFWATSVLKTIINPENSLRSQAELLLITLKDQHWISSRAKNEGPGYAWKISSGPWSSKPTSSISSPESSWCFIGLWWSAHSLTSWQSQSQSSLREMIMHRTSNCFFSISYVILGIKLKKLRLRKNEMEKNSC